MDTQTVDKVRWEVGGEMWTPAGTVEIHSDEGDVIGFVYPQHAERVAATPKLAADNAALLAALEAITHTFGDYDVSASTKMREIARTAIAHAREAGA